ncbi:MAG: acetylaminoadipate kinase, partial [Candidatus Micrarchaeota archaeon]
MKPLIVVKIGGSIAGTPENLAKDIASLSNSYSFLIVHGGAKQTTELSEKLGLQPKFIISPSGVKSRYTDSQAIEVYTMAMRGKVNSSL